MQKEGREAEKHITEKTDSSLQRKNIDMELACIETLWCRRLLNKDYAYAILLFDVLKYCLLKYKLLQLCTLYFSYLCVGECQEA